LNFDQLDHFGTWGEGVYGLESTEEAGEEHCFRPLEDTHANLGAPLKLTKFQQ